MKVMLNIQKDGVNTLGDALDSACDLSLKKIYVVCGDIKESGFNKICEFVKTLKARKFFVVGVDKKNTTRRMLETLGSYTKNVYIFNNNGESEFLSSLFILEYQDRAVVYSVPDSITEELMYTDITMYTTIEWDLSISEELEDYKQYVSKVMEVSKLEEAVKVDNEVISDLVENKQVFSTKQYTHNIMSISELMAKSNKASMEKSEEEQAEDTDMSAVPKINLDEMADIDLDIDLGAIEVEEEDAFDEEIQEIDYVEENPKLTDVDSEEITEESDEKYNEDVVDEMEQLDFEVESEVTDLEGMLFETADISLQKVEKKKIEENITKSKRIDLKNVSNLLMQLNSKPTKGKDVNCIKVPTYIKEMVPDFFRALDDAEASITTTGVSQKQAKISIELVDVNSDKRYMDKEALLTYTSGQSNIAFVTSALGNVNYEEMDIARIIKLADNCYHIEIVPSTCEEYNLWNKLCTQNFRGSSRTYGLM